MNWLYEVPRIWEPDQLSPQQNCDIAHGIRKGLLEIAGSDERGLLIKLINTGKSAAAKRSAELN